MTDIVLTLWSNLKAEEQANYYVSLLPDSKINRIVRWPMDGSGPNDGRKKGDVLVVDFTLAGQSYSLLNGGPQFPYNEVVSIMVVCDGQAEVDKLWSKLIGDGGTESVCGWLKDKFGLSWQITPRRLLDLIGDNDTAKAARAMNAMMQMVKLDIGKIEAAAKG
jgi:2-polyprenyl-6-hydroxyphenyl methylase/3-demethylubiquinone-9 3-methyltransferase